MSLPIEFSKNGIAYGLLFPIGSWQMSFYFSERGRKQGYAHLRKLLGDAAPIFKFQLTLKEIERRSELIPAISRDIHQETDFKLLR